MLVIEIDSTAILAAHRSAQPMDSEWNIAVDVEVDVLHLHSRRRLRREHCQGKEKSHALSGLAVDVPSHVRTDVHAANDY